MGGIDGKTFSDFMSDPEQQTWNGEVVDATDVLISDVE